MTWLRRLAGKLRGLHLAVALAVSPGCKECKWTPATPDGAPPPSKADKDPPPPPPPPPLPEE